MQQAETFTDLCAAARYVGDTPRSAPANVNVADLIARIRSSALKVTAKTVPQVHRACVRVAERLLLPEEAEVYIMANPTPNAFAPAWAVGHRPIIVLHSGLVQLLSITELEVIIGHELGHLGLRHSNLYATTPTSEYDALQLRSYQRAAEISADRVGLLACRSMHLAARVMIKTASGLPDDLLGFDIDAFVLQMERDPSEVSRQWELELTHPSLPLRLWALLRFAHSDVYATLSGQGASGSPLSIIDTEISERLSAMGDGALTSMEEDVYQKALMWAGLSLVMSDNIIQAHEEEALVQLVGKELAEKAITFAKAHGKDAVEVKYTEAKRRLESVGSSMVQRFRTAEEAFRFTLGVDRKD